LGHRGDSGEKETEEGEVRLGVGAGAELRDGKRRRKEVRERGRA
jgi:hypothetical protein